MTQPVAVSNIAVGKRQGRPLGASDAFVARAVVAIIVACVFENFILALISQNFYPVTEQLVAIIQLLLTIAALAIGAYRGLGLAPGFYWAVYAFLFLYGIAVWRIGDADFRFLYDASVIPIFILLGAALPRFPVKTVMIVLAVVVAVALIELLLPDVYTGVVNPLGYYLDTRDWVRGQFEDVIVDGPGLYMGSQRWTGTTFLNFLSDTRLGSIFMEPLSLGYFAVVVSLVANYFFAASWRARYAVVGLCGLLAVLADSRVSVFCIVAISLLWPLARRIPRGLALVPPIAALIAFIAVAAFSGGDLGSSELANRLSVTIDALQGANVADILFGGVNAERSGDSAIISMISNAGLFSVPLLLALYSGLFSARRAENPLHWGTFLYILAASLFGAALFSIKTAPLLGLLIGYVSAHPRQEP
jgi:putative polymerase